MPLLDHFHPPLSDVRYWEAFHGRWASALADALNRDLPPRYFAEAQVHVGSRVEVDVATFDDPDEGTTPRGATATATLAAPAWTTPATIIMPVTFPDSLEVLVYNREAGPTLAAAVELVSPGNKDRPENRRAFAAKCGTFLREGVGLIIMDIVTSRRANLHNELVEMLEAGDPSAIAEDAVYAVAYRPVRRAESATVEAWPAKFEVGKALPMLPLALDKGLLLPIDFEAAYNEARQRSRLP